MILGFVSLILVLGGAALMFFNRKRYTKKSSYSYSSSGTYEEYNELWYTGLCASIIGVLLFFFGSLLPTGIGYSNQIGDKNAIIQYQQNETIYKAKADKLTSELRGYLAVEYPNLEQKVFDKIASNPTALFTIYPQLRSADTLVALAGQITSLQNQVYAQETNITAAEKNIRTRKQSPWLLGFIIPNG